MFQVNISRIHWSLGGDIAEETKDIVVVCTGDGKVRMYNTKEHSGDGKGVTGKKTTSKAARDLSANLTTIGQKRPIFELPVCYKRERSGQHTGSSLKLSRPVVSSDLRDGILTTGDSVGNIDM